MKNNLEILLKFLPICWPFVLLFHCDSSINREISAVNFKLLFFWRFGVFIGHQKGHHALEL